MRIFMYVQYFCMATAAILPMQEKVSQKFHDVTDPLNALMKGKISRMDFFATSGFTENGTETKTKLNLYALDCKTLDSCVDEINTLGRFWSDSLGRDISHDLTLSITLTLSELSDHTKDKDLNVNSKRPDFLLNYLFNIDEGTSCLDIQNVSNASWSHLTDFSNKQYGMGINEDLLECKLAVELVFGEESAWTVVYFKFGDTDGVPESFGIFHNLVSSKHDSIQQTIPHKYLKEKKNWYYPTAKAIGDDNHYRLFKTYMDHYDGKSYRYIPKKIELIIRTIVPSAIENGVNTLSKFSMVLCIKYGVESWYLAPSTVRTISKYFKSIILDNDQWKFWNSDTRKKLDNSINSLPLAEPIDTILDYSLATTNGTFEVDRKIIQEALETLEVLKETNSVEPLVLRSILFNIEIRESGNYSAQIDTTIGQQITSYGVKVGCTFLTETIMEAEAVAVVRACGEINGTIYILNKPDIELIDSTRYSFHYVNTVRKVLESAKEFRALIQILQPDAEVYLRLPTIRKNSNPLLDRPKKSSTPFCDYGVLNANEYQEAILNWAKFNHFPVIFNSAIDSPKNVDYLGLLSNLRPTFWDEDDLEYQPKVTEFHPLFVFCNYPKNIGIWTVDPCIEEWARDEPKIIDDYFLNKHVGTIFDTRHIRQNESIQSEEYQMLLSFISHRFNLVEIILSSNWQEFVSACKEFDTDLLNGPQKNYFIDYAHPCSASLLHEEPSKSKVFTELLNAIPKNGKCATQGVHLDLSIYDLEEIINDSKMVQQLIGKELESGINIGILLNSTICVEVFQLILFRNESAPHIINRLSYLVCKERYNIDTLLGKFNDPDYTDRIGKVLDTHLYLKRVFKEFQPNLDIYFRIEVDVVLDDEEYQTAMRRYLQLISHFKEFGKAYDISYFVVQAFDEESGHRNGWWTNNIYTNLSNSSTYVEKESVYAGREMWKPLPLRPKTLPNDPPKTSVTVIVASVFVVILVCGLMALSAFHYMRYKKMRQFLSDEEVKEFKNGKHQATANTVTQGPSMCASVDCMKFLEKYDLQLPDLCIDQQCLLGTGNFGVVYKGTAKGIPAAIKQPNQNCPKGSFKSFLMEIKVHCYIGVHTNIVGFLGAYTEEINIGTLLIATELCPNGSLKGLLRRKTTVISFPNQNENLKTLSHCKEEKAIEVHDLCRFSHEIASGMDYLESKKVVHGDLAARNVLLNENYTCKIGDFGLSRKLYEYQKYVKKSQEPLPWKWMAYESLTKMEFTSKSDVWSYGVTLWEIFSLGKIPYGAMNWNLDFSDELQKGLRLGKPEFSSEQIYEKMLECWNLDTERRPEFSELVEFFREIFTPLQQSGNKKLYMNSM